MGEKKTSVKFYSQEQRVEARSVVGTNEVSRQGTKEAKPKQGEV